MTFQPWAVDMGAAEQNITVPMTVSESSGAVSMDAEHVIRQYIVDYTGPYEVTPTQTTQLLQVNGLRATENIKINPIPSNYGLITWNGSTLTVS